MPAIINSGDSEAVVKQKIIDILEFDGINTDNIVSWGTVTNRLNSAAFMLGLPQIDNGLAGATTRERINALALSPAPVFPTNTVLPSISGTPRYNQQLTGNIGTWSAYPAAIYNYQWKADGVNISGATAQNYTLTQNELGKVITLEVRATNQSGTATATSSATATVTSTPVNSSVPVISGTIANGQTISASTGSWIAFPVPTYTYQWKANGVNISGATSSTYALQNSEVGKAISVSVVATNSQGNSTANSTNTALVTSIPVNTALPVVAAEAVEGQTVSTTTGTWVGHPAITYTYQWRRNSVNISGATSASYTIVTADIGQNISVTVTATNSQGNNSASSASQIARPTWAAGVDSWRNFASDIGNIANPTDTHTAAINAPNAAGVYSSFAPNVLVRTDLGVQTVPTRTNGVANNSMVGAVTGTPGTIPTGWGAQSSVFGLTRQIVGTGTINGLPYIDIRWFGTATTNELIVLDPTMVNGGISASVGQVWASSAFLALMSGTLPTNIPFGLSERTSSDTFLNQLVANISSQITSTLTRIQRVITLTAPTVGKVTQFLRFYIDNGQAYDFTLRIAAPQLELGAFASPPILTTGTAAQVFGNQQVITGLGPSLVTGVAGFIQVDMLQGGQDFVRLLTLSDGTDSNRMQLTYAAANLRFEARIAGVDPGNLIIQNAPTPALRTIAFCYKAGFMKVQLVGGANIASTSPAYPTGLSQLNIGGSAISLAANAYQFTRKLALDYLAPGDDPATKFNEVFAKAQLAAVAP